MSTFPTRCFTCGKVTRWGGYEDLLEKGVDQDTALDQLGYRRMCCRRMFLGHIPELEEKLLLYTKEPVFSKLTKDIGKIGIWADHVDENE